MLNTKLKKLLSQDMSIYILNIFFRTFFFYTNRREDWNANHIFKRHNYYIRFIGNSYLLIFNYDFYNKVTSAQGFIKPFEILFLVVLSRFVARMQSQPHFYVIFYNIKKIKQWICNVNYFLEPCWCLYLMSENCLWKEYL